MYIYILADQRPVCRQHDELGHSSVVETGKVLQGAGWLRVNLYRFIYMYIYICIYTYIYIYIYTYLYMYTIIELA